MSPKLLLSQLKEKISEKFRDVSFKLYERMPTDQATYLYWLLGATALGGVVDAPNFTAALAALGKIIGDVGLSTFGDLIKSFLTKKDEDERQRLLREAAQNSNDVRNALDLLLKKANALSEAQLAYQQTHPKEEEQQQFSAALQNALERAGSSLKISKSRVKGKAVAIGHKAKAQNISAKQSGVAVGKIKAKNVVIKTTARESATSRTEATARKNYLESMRTACNLLPLAALADDRDPHRGAAMSLSQVYIDLYTTSFKEQLASGKKKKAASEFGEREQVPLTALEVALQHSALVLLGEPGSGKSSFTNHLLYLCAGALLHQQKNLLPLNWPSTQTLPVRIVLRELAIDLNKAEAESWLQLSAEERDRKLLDLIFTHLKTRLEECQAPGFNEDLQTHLRRGKCLLVLDGLDEVAVAQRPLLRAAITALRERLGPNRYIVTCRTRSWDDKHPLPAFHTSTLAHFTEEQVEQFVQHWYGALHEAKQFTDKETQARIVSMNNAIDTLEKDLVANPLLLTTMAVVHYNDTELPRERVKLYKRAAEVLLKRWQRHRAGNAGLLESLGIRDRELYPALYELAHAAHDTAKDKTAADLSYDEAHKILRRHFAGLEAPQHKATAFLEYADQTAGLLHGRGGVENLAYSFPHRTFQEYFAGVHLTKGQSRFEDELKKKLAEGEYWQVAGQLGLEDLLHNAQMPFFAHNAAYALCAEQPQSEAEWRGVLWSALFAAEIGVEQIKADVNAHGPQYLARVTNNLIKLIEGNKLTHRERIEAGFVLGKLGDTRPGVCSFPLDWVQLPGGRFIMGDEEDGPAHEVELAPFKISRYPVTNAQFAAFVQAGGYEKKDWWSDAGWKARQKEKWEQPDEWKNLRFNLPNQPVVGVSWFEAEAFCNWLSAEGMAHGAEGKKMTVRLPTEAEWEFAARGKAGRIFSWGDKEPTAELANYERNVGRTTAVGNYPLGATPEGICDLTGNVWEWCGDWYEGGYYATCKQQGIIENPTGP